MPVELNISLIMPTTTTTERKCGRYVTVCTIFLYRCEPSSLSSSARIIGAGKVMSRLIIFSVIVFLKTSQKYGSSTIMRIYFMPPSLAHGLWRMPSFGLKFLNASVTPYIG